MKSKMNLLALSALLLAGGISASPAVSSSAALPNEFHAGVKKEGEVDANLVPWDYLAFDANNFTRYAWDSDTSSWVVSSNQDLCLQPRLFRFWTNRSFDALDVFHRGFNDEGAKSMFQSKKWTQEKGHDYITFTMGGGPTWDVMRNCRVEIYEEGGSTPIASVGNDYFHDPYRAENMILRSIKLDTSSWEGSKKLFLRLVDEENGGGFRAVNFGALRVNQTLETASRALSTYINNMNNVDTGANAERNSVPYESTLSLINMYKDTDEIHPHADRIASEYAGLSEEQRATIISSAKAEYGPLMEYLTGASTSINGNVSFDGYYRMTDLAFDASYGNHHYVEDGKTYDFNGAILDDTEEADVLGGTEGNSPFNNEGQFFRGNNFQKDFGESASYRLITPEFTVKEPGIISVKMGGRAARVSIFAVDENGRKTGDALASVNNLAFANFPGDTWQEKNIMKYGADINTMVRHVIDASAFIGQKVVLGLEKNVEVVDNWAFAWFDSVKTDYAADLSDFLFRADQIEQINEFGHYYGERYDRFAVATNGGKTSSHPELAEAANFLSSFYSSVRAVGVDGDNVIVPTHCGKTRTEYASLLSSYEGLSASAKALVDSAEDVGHGIGSSQNWYETVGEKTTVGNTMAYISNLSTATANRLTIGANNNPSTWIVAAAASGVIVLASLFLLRHKKKEE